MFFPSLPFFPCTFLFGAQTVIQMAGFRSLAKGEAVQFEAKPSDKGLEATLVMGISDKELQGSTFRPKKRLRKLKRCYNCGQWASHLASECEQGPLPKRCHNCKSEAHLVADCPEKPKTPAKGAAVTPTTPSQWLLFKLWSAVSTSLIKAYAIPIKCGF